MTRRTHSAWLRARPPRLRLLLPLAAVGWALVLLAALVALGVRGVGQTRPGALEVFGEAPVFGLTDQLERPFTSDQLRGRVVVANFIYTNCTDTCPLLSVRMQALQGRLREEGLLGDRVQLLSFTVDPAHDTPAVLREYAARHDADPDAWRFLSGPEKYLVPLVVQGFRLGVQPIPAAAGGSGGPQGAASNRVDQVMHSNRFVLLDRQGRIRAYYDGLELDPERVVRDIRQLLR